MPIVQITVAPSVADTLRHSGPDLIARIREDLMQHLAPKPDMIQIMIQAALLPPAGCDTLCNVQHRASESRGADVRAACASALHDTLRAATGSSVRVRLVAVNPAEIGACDTPEAER